MWSDISIDAARPKEEISQEIRDKLRVLGFSIVEENLDKPWGGYFRMSDGNVDTFLKTFFEGVSLPDWAHELNFAPKILLVAPEKRLSWQYHSRRGEFWKIIRGPVGVYLSQTDDLPGAASVHETGETVEIPLSIRHRLSGEKNWGIVAEIWVHVDRNNPSNEGDIVRLQDDFGRG